MSPSLARRIVVTALAAVALAGCKDKKATPRVTPAQWAEVEAMGAPALAPGPPDELTRALALVEDDDFAATLAPGFDPRDERLAEEVSDAAVDAVEALIRWHQAGGRLPPRECVGGKLGLAAARLARVALLVAGADSDAPAVHAVMTLASRYRAEGQSILEGMIGTSIADGAREWATKLGLPPTGALRGYAPTEDGLRRIVAAEALCSMSLVAKHLTDDDPTSATMAREYSARTGEDVTAMMAREAAGLRLYWVDLLADLRGRDADPVATDRRISARAEQLGRDTLRHPVLSMVVPATGHTIERLREADEAQRAWLASAP